MLAKENICRRRRKAKAMMRGEGGRPRPFEDKKPSVEEEQQQLEKKLPGEEGSQFEEEPKRRRTKDDVDLHDFDEGDSDDVKDDDFMSRFKIAEYDDWNGGKEADEMGDCDRKCLKVRRCHKHQHAERFSGVPLFEIFSFKLKLNNKYFSSSSVEGLLYGILEVDTSDDPKPIPYYRVSQSQSQSQSHMDADSIALKIEPADLYDQSGVQIVRGKNFFPAKESGRTSKYIKDKNRVPILKVEVDWGC